MADKEVVCPREQRDLSSAIKRLGCGKDEYDISQYICLPNKGKTRLEELCFDGTMKMQEKGNCLEISEGNLSYHSCENFSWGCPDKPFRINEILNYPACQAINKKLNCYILDPSCHSNDIASNEETVDKGKMLILVGIVLGIVLIVIVFMILWKKLRRRTSYRAAPMVQEQRGENEAEDAL